MRERELSRREFLKFGIGALAFLAELGLPKDIFAQLEEILKKREFITEDFEKGLAALKEKVWDTKEHFWVYVKKDTKKGWIDAAESTTEMSVTAIGLEPILRDKEVKEIHFVHTHPPYGYSPRKNRDEMRIPAMPSHYDLTYAAYLRAYAQFNSFPLERMRIAVLDATGTWRYDVDPEHEAMRELMRQSFEGENPQPPPELERYLLEQQKRLDDAKEVTGEHLKEMQDYLSRNYGAVLRYEKDRD